MTDWTEEFVKATAELSEHYKAGKTPPPECIATLRKHVGDAMVDDVLEGMTNDTD